MANVKLLLGLLWAIGCGTSLGQDITTSITSGSGTSLTAVGTTTKETTTPVPTTQGPSAANSATNTLPVTTIPQITDALSTVSDKPTSITSNSAIVPLTSSALTVTKNVDTSNLTGITTTKPTTEQISQITTNAANTAISNATGPQPTSGAPSQLSPQTENSTSTGQNPPSNTTQTPVPNVPSSTSLTSNKTPETPNKTHESTTKLTSVITNPSQISPSPSQNVTSTSQTSVSPNQNIASTINSPVHPAVYKETTASVSPTSTRSVTPGLGSAVPNINKSTMASGEHFQIICQNTIFNDSQLKIIVKKDSTQKCNNNLSDVNLKSAVEQVCKAIKPGFQISTDKCEVVLGYNAQQDDRLAIVQALVETHLNASDLFPKLKSIKYEDGTNMFAYGDKVPTDELDDWLSMPLIITIVSLAASLLIIAAIYGCWHQRRSQKRDQRLTEELQTMENGYHDNPTLEVMETSPEMQEKKGGLNGELGDSWIVPLDNLTREDLDEEEDTHL
ncbi:podocalyxin [Pelobates fuscus]|uniref:podocalyxin n=1 Tax=Pelobates fuscus TaxID=191477 RepID=UPI002FE4D33A